MENFINTDIISDFIIELIQYADEKDIKTFIKFSPKGLNLNLNYLTYWLTTIKNFVNYVTQILIIKIQLSYVGIAMIY